MARLIDANKVLEKADEVIFMGFRAEERKRHFMDLVSEILKQPTVDAVPVVHGRWINKTNVIHGQVDYMFVCSACGYIHWDSITDFCYCPNCGAHMDLEVKDA